MRYVFGAVVALALCSLATPAEAGLHAICAIIEKCHAKHDSCFEKLRHHCAMKPKHKHHGADDCGCSQCD
jgi:hypothetical protein